MAMLAACATPATADAPSGGQAPGIVTGVDGLSSADGGGQPFGGGSGLPEPAVAAAEPFVQPTSIPTPTPTPTPLPPPCPSHNRGSFLGCYFEGPYLTQLVVMRDDAGIDFNWLDGAPTAAQPPDQFSVQWKGEFDLAAGSYEFVVTADDRVRLVVDGVPLVDAWYDQDPTVHRVYADLATGLHRIQLDYADGTGLASVRLQWGLAEDPAFAYSWQASAELTGEVSFPAAAPRPVVVLGGEPTLTLNSTASLRLAKDFGIVLVDDEAPWDQETAGLLYEMVRRLPGTRLQVFDAHPWRVTLADESLVGDVGITLWSDDAPVNHARFSRAAFARSNPTLQSSADGNADRVFYSNRLFRAVLKAFYNDRYLMAEILEARYGVAVALGEPEEDFQQFTVGEMQYLASVMEDLPSGFRSIPGLENIVRRRDGLTNPVYPSAPAIAWVTLGYIEFMDSAFTSGDAEFIRRLIAHEMSHFLWHKVLTTETRDAFLALSGWSQSPSLDASKAATVVAADHPKAGAVAPHDEVWYRETTTNFVSDYAAALDPGEDFAETVSYYVYLPDKVRTFAPDKYGFIADIVDGYEYITLVDEQFTFQVFNLEPDYTFPGKIVAVETTVAKSVNGDNLVTATLRLSPQYGDGAARALARLFSPSDTYMDLAFWPANGDPFTLTAEFTLNRFMANGYWNIGSITVEDSVDNRRFEGQDQFGWQLYLDNPGEDLEAPIVDLEAVVGELIALDDGQALRVIVPLTDEESSGLGGYARLQQYASTQELEQYARYELGSGEVVFTYPLRSYIATGEWVFREFWVFDSAGNQRRYDLKEKALTFDVTTAVPDYVKPELDVGSVRIEAVPRHPEAPDGETDVTIWYRARDDNSGIGVVSYRLLKPTGDTLFDYHYHENFYTGYFAGTPDEFQEYRIDLTLPAGSPPGTWALSEMVIRDKAGNTLTSDFIETGIVRPIEVLGDEAPDGPSGRDD